MGFETIEINLVIYRQQEAEFDGETHKTDLGNIN